MDRVMFSLSHSHSHIVHHVGQKIKPVGFHMVTMTEQELDTCSNSMPHMFCFLLAESNALCTFNPLQPIRLTPVKEHDLSLLCPLALSVLSLCAVEGGKCRKEKEGKSTVMDPLALAIPVRLTAMGKWCVCSPWGCLEWTSCLISICLPLFLSLSQAYPCERKNLKLF